MKTTELTQKEFEDAVREAFRKKNPELADQEFAFVVNYDNYHEKVAKIIASHN